MFKIELQASLVEEMETEYYFYTTGNSGSFTTSLFDTFKKADTHNFYKLSKSFPYHGYLIALNFSEHQLRHFEVRDVSKGE